MYFLHRGPVVEDLARLLEFVMGTALFSADRAGSCYPTCRLWCLDRLLRLLLLLRRRHMIEEELF